MGPTATVRTVLRAGLIVRAEVAILAGQFWARVSEPFPFPRDIERAAMLAVPVVVMKLPRLTTGTIAAWLTARHATVAVPLCRGEMAGCVVAHRGRAVIFVSGTDPAEERRATVAHELAHFLRHYLAVRERVVQALGPRILEVLDADRPPTFAERGRSILRDVRLGMHVHVLPREDRRGAVAQVEREADELGLELAAPCEAVEGVLRSMRTNGPTAHERRVVLGQHFGLPPEWLLAYVPDPPAQPRDRLGALLTQLRRRE
jgi:hypothetical protein